MFLHLIINGSIYFQQDEIKNLGIFLKEIIERKNYSLEKGLSDSNILLAHTPNLEQKIN